MSAADDFCPEQVCICQLCGAQTTSERDGWKVRKHLGWVCGKHSNRIIRAMQNLAQLANTPGRG